MYYKLSLNPSLFLDSEDETHAYELMIIDILYFYRLVAFFFLDLQKGKKLTSCYYNSFDLKIEKKKNLEEEKKLHEQLSYIINLILLHKLM